MNQDDKLDLQLFLPSLAKFSYFNIKNNFHYSERLFQLILINMNDELKFCPINSGGTHLVAYLYGPDHPYRKEPLNLGLDQFSFEELVGKLYTLSQQEIFENSDQYKSSFFVSGMFKDQPFDLYDYKADRMIHVGGNDSLDIPGLFKALNSALVEVNPKSYLATLHYDKFAGQTYQF